MSAFSWVNDVSSEYNQMWWIDIYEWLCLLFDKKGISYSDFLLEIKNSNIADIGSWLGLSQKYLSILWSNILCVDPVYNKELSYTINDLTRQFNERLSKISYFFTNKESLDEDQIDFLTTQRAHLKLDIFNLKNWEKINWNNYKLKLDKSDSIDIAFSTNVFALIPEWFDFLEDIFDKLNDWWKYYLIDDFSLKEYKNVVFIKTLIDENIIEWYYNNDLIVWEIKKGVFLEKRKKIGEIYKSIIKDFKKWNSKEQNIKISDIKALRALKVIELIPDIISQLINFESKNINIEESNEKEIWTTDFIITKEDFKKWNFDENISSKMVEEIKKLNIKAHSDFLHFYLWAEWEILCEQEDNKEDF
jgi:hypothetical protein